MDVHGDKLGCLYTRETIPNNLSQVLGLEEVYCEASLSVMQASACDETKYGPSPPSLWPIAEVVKGTHEWRRGAK